MSIVGPGLVIGAFIVLITAQVTRLLVGGAYGPYVWTLLLAAVGFVAGEWVATVTRLGGPMLGPLHPIIDIVAVALFQAAGALAVLPLTRRRREP